MLSELAEIDNQAGGVIAEIKGVVPSGLDADAVRFNVSPSEREAFAGAVIVKLPLHRKRLS